MDHSVIFARQFAHLLWLLLHEPDNTAEQKAALRLLLNTARMGPVSLALHGEDLQANANSVPAGLTGVWDVTTQMDRHGLALVTVDAATTAAELLGTTRILASMPVIGDGGAAVEAQRLALKMTTVRFAARPRFSQEVRPLDTAARETVAMEAMEFGDVLDDPLGEAMARATPRSTQSVPMPSEARGEERGMFAQFAASRAPTESPEALLRQLEGSLDSNVIVRALEDLTVLAESAAREGKAGVVSEIMYRIARREPDVEHFESRRAFAMALRRLAKPEVLRLIARQLPRDAAHREAHESVLSRAGDAGTDALIEQIGTAAQRDRDVHVAALARSASAVPALIRMLSDQRSNVARIAAEVLGEMQAAEAEQPLTALLKHDEERVRKAATASLMRLGTPRALQAIQQALADSAPQTRMQAAAALATRKDVRTSAPQLLRALDSEKDDEVQAAILHALGKLATPEAVQRLVSASEGRKGLFQRKSASLRIAAVNALADARTPDAMTALHALEQDRDDDVRAAVTLALGRVSRASQPG